MSYRNEWKEPKTQKQEQYPTKEPMYVEDILENKMYQAQLQDGFYRSPKGIASMTKLRQDFLEYCTEQTKYPSLELTRSMTQKQPGAPSQATYLVREQKEGG